MESHLLFSEDTGVRAYAPFDHYHSEYELYYLTKGRCRYFFGNKTYRLYPGDLVLIPPGVIHNVLYESDSHSRLLIQCTEDYVPPSVIPLTDRLPFFSGRTEISKQLSSLFQRFRETEKLQDAFYQDTMRCLCMQLFLLLARSASAEQPIVRENSFVEQAVTHIQNSYMDRLSLTDTAKICAVSPEHLSRTFKKETGFGFTEYLNLYRLKKAESMLKSGQSRSIAQVAIACGFGDSNYFSSAYKRCFGVSPSQVRKATEQEEDYHV